MSKKDLEIVCPCCESRLLVDLRTETVVRARRPEELDESGRPKVGDADWSSAFDRVRARTRGEDRKLDQAVERERQRTRSLDDRFDEARRKAEDEDESTEGTGSTGR